MGFVQELEAVARTTGLKAKATDQELIDHVVDRIDQKTDPAHTPDDNAIERLRNMSRTDIRGGTSEREKFYEAARGGLLQRFLGHQETWSERKPAKTLGVSLVTRASLCTDGSRTSPASFFNGAGRD